MWIHISTTCGKSIVAVRPISTWASTWNPHGSELNRIESGTCAIRRQVQLWGHAIRHVYGLRVRAASGTRSGWMRGRGGRTSQGFGLSLKPREIQLDRRGQSRASSTPIWRLGVPYERPVRDSVGLIAPAVMNQVGWPSGLGINVEAPSVSSRSGNRRRHQGEERRRKLRLQPVTARSGHPATTGWPFRFGGAGRGTRVTRPASRVSRPPQLPSRTSPDTPVAGPAARWFCCSPAHRR